MEQGHTNPWFFSAKLGFYAGLIWGGLRCLLYEIHFTSIVSGFLVEPFFKHEFLITGWGKLLGVGFFIVFSIAAAMLYALILRNKRGPWVGIVYGGVWWAVLFLLLGTFLSDGGGQLAQWQTLLTELSVFLIWGVFIGYTIAFEFTDEASREPANA